MMSKSASIIGRERRGKSKKASGSFRKGTGQGTILSALMVGNSRTSKKTANGITSQCRGN